MTMINLLLIHGHDYRPLKSVLCMDGTRIQGFRRVFPIIKSLNADSAFVFGAFS